MKTIVHFSTSHFPNDNRIYYKEIIGAKKAGYDVSFIVAHDSVDNKVAGRTYKLKRSANKFKRYIVNQIIGVYRIYKIRPSIVQFHDPELLLSGLVLHYLLKPTHLIYDVHEDNYTGLMERGNPQNYTRVKLALAHIPTAGVSRAGSHRASVPTVCPCASRARGASRNRPRPRRS